MVPGARIDREIAEWANTSDCNQPHAPVTSDGGKTGHFCIGCVASPALPFADSPLPLPAAAPVAQPMTALAGANAPPSIPPPRP